MNDSVEGFLEIQDGIYEIRKKIDDSDKRRGLVREDMPPVLGPNFFPSDNKKSFQVDVTCITYASIIDESILMKTKTQIIKEDTYIRVASKNYTKDIKEFVCGLAGSRQASFLRKRLIALEKIQKTISNQKFRFTI